MAHRVKAKAAALFVHDKRMLLVFKDKIGFWITPGGKMEKGETPHDCLVRELKEELDCGVKNPQYFQTVLEEIKESPGEHIAILGYMCELTGIPKPQKEIGQAKWFTYADLISGKNVAHGAKIFAEDLRAQNLM